jgi:uroporphyrinogen decarboxylase
VQGNLDPAVLGAPWPVVAEQVRDVLRRNGGRPGHVFNLGHGVLPDTDPDVLARVVELVHEEL